MNEVYFDNVSGVLEENTYKPMYNYNKLTRDTSYTYKDNFDSIYKKIKYDLSLLELPKMFNKYKNRNIVRYGAYPAYPVIDYINDDMFKSGYESTIGNIPNTVNQIKEAQNTRIYYQKVAELKSFAKDKPADYMLSEEEYNYINNTLDMISEILSGNDFQKETLKFVLNVMELGPDIQFGKYKKAINKLDKYAKSYSKTFGEEEISNLINNNLRLLKEYEDVFLNTFIQKKHRPAMRNMIHQYTQSLMRNNYKKEMRPEDYLNQIIEHYEKWHILNNQEELLNTYLESVAKDTEIEEGYKESYETMLYNTIGYANLAEMETIIMDAIDNGNEMEVKNAFKDIYLDLKDGSKLPMSSDEIIAQMVSNLIMGENIDTALKFIEKFGLNEQYAVIFAKKFNLDKLKELIDEVGTADKNFKAFAADFDSYTEDAYQNISEGANAIREINSVKRQISESLKRNNIKKKAAKPLFEAFDSAKQALISNPEIDAVELLKTILNNGMYEVVSAPDKSSETLKQMLEETQVYMDLYNNIILEENSEANIMRNKIEKEWADFLEYCKTTEHLQVM